MLGSGSNLGDCQSLKSGCASSKVLNPKIENLLDLERERMLIKYCKTSITLRKLYWMMLASEKGPNGQTEEKQKIQFLTLLGTR